MTCAFGDVACGITQFLAPFAITAALVLVLLFFGAFGGKTGKIIAVVGVIIVFLWWFGLDWMGIPLQPLRHYAGMAALAPVAALVPDPFEWRRWRWTQAHGGGRNG